MTPLTPADGGLDGPRPGNWEAGFEEGSPAELSGTVVKGVSYAASGYLLAQAINLGFYLALARLLTPGDFGDFAAATALYGFALLATESGMMSALIHRRDRLDEALATATISTALGGIGLSLLALAIAPLIGVFFDSDRIATISAAMCGVIFLRSTGTVPAAILQRRFSFLRRLVVEPAQVIAFGTAAVTAAALGMGVWSLVIGQYAGFTIEAILSWLLVKWRPHLKLASFAMWRELVGYGRHVLAATAILRVGEQADTVVVGRFLGVAQLGQFRYAFRLASTPFQALLAGASYVLFPAFARISDEEERFHAAILRSLKWMCVVAMPAGLVLVPLGEPLAVLLFGDVWREAGYAVMGMALYTGGSALSSLASEALKAAGRPDPLTRMHTVTALAGVAAMLALAPLGLSAVAVGLSIGAMVGGAYALGAVHRVIGIPTSRLFAQVWKPLLAALVMAGAGWALESQLVNADSAATLPGLLLVALEGLACAGLYLAVLAMLAPDTIHGLIVGTRRMLSRRAGTSRPAGAESEEGRG